MSPFDSDGDLGGDLGNQFTTESVSAVSRGVVNVEIVKPHDDEI